MGDILLVEDHAVYRDPIRAVLEHAGHSVRAVPDGLAALWAFAERMPDLVMLDLGMPNLGGQDVLTHLRSLTRGSDLPVIVVTGKTDRQTVTDMARLGVSAYLSKKEFSLDHLLIVVAEALESKDTPSTHADEPALHLKEATGTGPLQMVSSSTSQISLDDENVAPISVFIAKDAKDALRAIRPQLSGREAARRLASACELEGFSPAVREILTLTEMPGCTIEAVAKAVSQDAAMSLRVIKLANSAAYSRGTAVDTVRRAVVQIGITRIRQTVQTLGIVEQFAGPAFDAHIDTGQFWEHSVACGIIAAEIARATDPASADTAFTSGLLHDVGRLILAKEMGPLYVEVLETARRMGLPLELVESRVLSVNHASMMEEIAKRWRLPEDLVLPITLHHAPASRLRGYTAAQRASVWRVDLANRLAHALLVGSSGNDVISPTIDLCRLLELDLTTIARIETETRLQTQEMRTVMFGKSRAPHPQPLEQYRSLLHGQFRPLFIGDEPAFDACRMACSTLAGKAKKGLPTIAVVSVSDHDSHAAVASRLLAAERSASVRELPMIMVSATGGVGGDLSVLGNRPSSILRLPVPMGDFVQAVNELMSRSSSNAVGIGRVSL